jgi:2'-5' RNA ligase
MTYHCTVRPVSFLAVLERIEALAPRRPWVAATKTAEIKTGPRTFFVHVRVPDVLAGRLRAVQREVIPDASRHQEIDHVTLVHVQKPREEEHRPDKVEAAIGALKAVAAEHEPIKARIQGWGYFDGAEKDGRGTTALVALLDAPGLEHLHVGMANALKEHGITPSGSHIFTPHITLGYLEQHGRSDQPLPPLSGSFTIDKAHVAARGLHEIRLTGGSGLAKAAADHVLRLTGRD